jgi:MFS family permease
MFVRSVLSFFSVLAFGVMAAAAVFAAMPWLSAHVPDSVRSLTENLQFGSLTIGLALGLILGAIVRCDWADIPRRTVTWLMVREQKFFYYSLIAICAGVLVFY